MVEYICNRCGYSAKQKSHLLNHLNRKNICSPLLVNISIEDVKKYYGFIKQQEKPVLEQEKPVFDSFSKPGKNQEKPAFQKTRTGKNQGKPVFLEKKK